MEKTVVVHMADVKAMAYQRLRERRDTGQRGLDRYLRPAADDPLIRRAGAGLGRVHDFSYNDENGNTIHPSTSDALHWMDYGFVAPEMLNTAVPVPVGFQTRPAWNEDDGDLDIGRLEAGYDDFFLGRTEQMSKPGIHIQFDCWFACGVPNTVIAEYGRWIMQLIASMEGMGFDLTIDAYSVTNNTFSDDKSARAVAIRVKSQQENNDMTSYSCLFSPVGTRLITFTAMATAAKKAGKQVSGYFGMARGGNWDLKYDQESGVVRITAAQLASYSDRYSKFPGVELTAKAVEAGLIPEQ